MAAAQAAGRGRWRRRRRRGRRSTAASSAAPRASPAAIAEASVQPVPCVCVLAMRGAAQLVDVMPVVEQVDDVVAGQVAALDQHRLRTERVQAQRRLAGGGERVHLVAGQRRGLGRVRRQQVGAAAGATRAPPPRRSASSSVLPLLAIITGSTTTAGGRCAREGVDDRADHVDAAEHAGLDRVGADVAEHGVDLGARPARPAARARPRRRPCSAP